MEVVNEYRLCMCALSIRFYTFRQAQAYAEEAEALRAELAHTRQQQSRQSPAQQTQILDTAAASPPFHTRPSTSAAPVSPAIITKQNFGYQQGLDDVSGSSGSGGGGQHIHRSATGFGFTRPHAPTPFQGSYSAVHAQSPGAYNVSPQKHQQQQNTHMQQQPARYGQGAHNQPVALQERNLRPQTGVTNASSSKRPWTGAGGYSNSRPASSYTKNPAYSRGGGGSNRGSFKSTSWKKRPGTAVSTGNYRPSTSASSSSTSYRKFGNGNNGPSTRAFQPPPVNKVTSWRDKVLM